MNKIKEAGTILLGAMITGVMVSGTLAVIILTGVTLAPAGP